MASLVVIPGLLCNDPFVVEACIRPMGSTPTAACGSKQEEEDRQREVLEAQIARAQAEVAEAEDGPAEGTELKRDEDGQPLQIALAAAPKPAQPETVAPLVQGFGRDDRGNKVCAEPATAP